MSLFVENEEFGGTHDVPSAPNAGHPQESDLCTLSKVLVYVGILAIVLGCVCAITLSEDSSRYFSHTNWGLVVLYIAGGVLSGIFNFALAVIVDACQKYRESR